MRPSVPLGGVCLVIAGQSPDGSFYNAHGRGLPFYQGKKEFGERYIGAPTTWTTEVTKEAQEGDILISVRAPVGPINFATQRMCIGRGLAAIRCDGSKLHRDFLFYQLLFKRPEISGKEGAVFASINKADIEAIQIWLPHADEQRRIVAILDEAFEGIATAKAHAEKNLRNARELFDGMTQALFPEDEQIGTDAKSLEDLCELIVDCEHRTAPIEAEGIPSVRTPNIGKGKLLLEGVNRVSEATYREWTRRAQPQGGDLVLAREAPAGNVAVIPEGMKLCLGQRTVLIRPRKSVLVPSYLAQLLLRRDSQKRLLAHSRGATVQHINLKDIRAFKIGRLPSLGTQAAVIERVEEIGDQDLRLKGILEKRMAALDELKQSLLHQAFSGQL